MWDDLARGAIGAVVLVDTRRLAECFAAVDYFERRRVPFVVAVNHFQDTHLHTLDEVREALAISDEVPVVVCDARLRTSARDTLVRLVEHAIATLTRSRR
jgi:signal recognition particle receptor subunit beta